MRDVNGEIDGLHQVAGFLVGTVFEDVAIQWVGPGARCEKCRALLLVDQGYPVGRNHGIVRSRGPFCVPCAVKLGMVVAFPVGSPLPDILGLSRAESPPPSL
jgi:hypothetical protein